MIKFNYIFKAVGPLHTGSDISEGIFKSLRRQKHVLPESLSYSSVLTDEARRDAVVNLCMGVWNSIDFDAMRKSRLLRVWDEFAAKLTAAGRCRDKYKFLDRLCRSWGIRSCTHDLVNQALDALTDTELLDIVRNETIYIVLKMRVIKDDMQQQWENNKVRSKDYKYPAIKKLESPIVVSRYDEELPCISGNSIRGKMRRIAMYDYCRRAGLTSLSKRVYHTFFSGGFLDSSSTYEDFGRLDDVCSHHPMLAVFGCAFGDMMIEGDMKIGWAYPLCSERETAGESIWEKLDTVFQTRKDSSKSEDIIDIETVIDGEIQDAPPQQMKYEYEVFAPGTIFEHRIALCTEDTLHISAFWHMITLFTEQPYIGGMGAVGNGEIDIDGITIPENANAEYLNYIEGKKNQIKEFWANVKV